MGKVSSGWGGGVIFLVAYREPNSFPNDSFKFRAYSTEKAAVQYATRKLKGKLWRIKALKVDPEDE